MKLALNVVWDVAPIAINQKPPSKDQIAFVMPLGVVVKGPKGDKGDTGNALDWASTNW